MAITNKEIVVKINFEAETASLPNQKVKVRFHPLGNGSLCAVYDEGTGELIPFIESIDIHIMAGKATSATLTKYVQGEYPSYMDRRWIEHVDIIAFSVGEF